MLYRDLRGWVGRKRRELQLQAYQSVTVDGTQPASVKKGKRNKKKPVVTVESLVVQAPDKVINLAGARTITHESSASETEMETETEDEEAENTDHGIDARLLSDAEVDATDNEEPENAVAILTQMSSAELAMQSTMLIPSTFGEKQNMRPLELTTAGRERERDGLPNVTPYPAVSSPVSTQSFTPGSRNQGDSHVYNGSSRQAMSRPAEAGTLPSPTKTPHITQPQPPLNPLQVLRRHSEYPPRPGSSASSQFCASSVPPPGGAPGKEDTAARAKLLLDSIANDQSRSTPSSQQRSAVPASLQMRPTFANVTPPAMPPQHAAPQSRPATYNDPRFGPPGQIPMNGSRPNIPNMLPQHGPPIPLNSHPGGPFPPIQRPIPVNAMPPYNSGSAPNSATDSNFTIRRTSLPFQDGPQLPFLPPPPHGPPHGPLGAGHHLPPPSINGFQLPPQMLRAQFPPPPHSHSAPPPGNNNLGLPPPNPALLDALLDRTPRASHVNPPNPNTLPAQQGHTHLPIPQPQAHAPPRRVVPHAPQLLALFGGDAGSGSGA